jgi:MarR family transcriptional regulator, organic hydroperoxide resistance regulator
MAATILSRALSSKSPRRSALPPVKGLNAWLAVVRTYQACSETLTARIKPLGLKLAHHDVLMSLLAQPEQTQQSLAEKSFVTKSHMSAVLTEMADLGWISRSDSAVDKRSKHISLTSAGLALARRAFAQQAVVVDAMMAPLSDKQIADLERVSRNAQAALNTLLREGSV